MSHSRFLVVLVLTTLVLSTSAHAKYGYMSFYSGLTSYWGEEESRSRDNITLTEEPQDTAPFGIEIGMDTPKLHLGLEYSYRELELDSVISNSITNGQNKVSQSVDIHTLMANWYYSYKDPYLLVQPYVGLGGGLMYAKFPTETQIAPVIQGILGLSSDITDAITVFGEYRLVAIPVKLGSSLMISGTDSNNMLVEDTLSNKHNLTSNNAIIGLRINF